MIIEINTFLCAQLISMIIMGCPGGKINMAAVSAKWSVIDSLTFVNQQGRVVRRTISTNPGLITMTTHMFCLTINPGLVLIGL